MVKFLPFPGFRPSLKDGESIDERISPPYDVISADELKGLQSKPHNVTRITLRPVDGRYLAAREELDSWMDDGVLEQDGPSFYLYEQVFDDSGERYVRSGIVGILGTEPYSTGKIIPHEETFPKVKEDRLNLLRDTETHCESIFGISEGLDEDLQARISSDAVRVYETEDERGVVHRFSVISDNGLVDEISSALAEQRVLIADGHHRFETACTYGEENPEAKGKQFVMATLVASNDPGLVVWPTHRLLRCQDFLEDDFIESLRQEFEVIDCPDTDDLDYHLGQGADMGIILRSGMALAVFAEKHEDPLDSLDTYIAQERIMKGILGYDQGKVEVSFEALMDEAKRRMKHEDHDLAIVFNPPSLDKVWEISGAGKRMPKKSTYFFPKIWSGFVYYRM